MNEISLIIKKFHSNFSNTMKSAKILRREDEVEEQKNISKIQMWKRDQSMRILERRGRKKMQAM